MRTHVNKNGVKSSPYSEMPKPEPKEVQRAMSRRYAEATIGLSDIEPSLFLPDQKTQANLRGNK